MLESVLIDSNSRLSGKGLHSRLFGISIASPSVAITLHLMTSLIVHLEEMTSKTWPKAAPQLSDGYHSSLTVLLGEWILISC